MSPINCCNCLSSFALIRGVPHKESTVTSSPFVISTLHCFSICANLLLHCLSGSLRNYHSIHVSTSNHQLPCEFCNTRNLLSVISCRRSTKLNSMTIQITSPCDMQMALQPYKVQKAIYGNYIAINLDCDGTWQAAQVSRFWL